MTMTSKRAFNTSSKNPLSTKLRTFNASKSATRQLEIDSRKMEERLRELKMTMSQEKQERERQGSGGYWRSGKEGALAGHGPNSSRNTRNYTEMPRSTKPKKITVLKDGPIKAPKRAVRPKLTARKTFDGPACGQCEEKAGALSCMECAELYCAACFAQFHLKGALKLHRSVPYQAGQELRRSKNDGPLSPRAITLKSNQQTERSSIDSTIAPEAMSSVESRQQKKSPVLLSNQQVSNGPSLLNGDYNEAESSASFAAALAEWRGQPQVTSKPTSSPHQSKPGVTTVNESTGTEQEPKHEIKIEFKECMSYADKLLLKKHRRTELPQIQTPRLETGRESNSRMYTQSVSPRETLNASSSNGLVDFDDGEELELELQEEHLRYASMFSTTSPVADGEIRCNSVVTITPLPENIDTSVIEEQTSYLVQEEPDDKPIMYTAQQPQIATTKGNNKKTSESAKINRKDENGNNVKKQHEKKSASEKQKRYLPRPPSDNSKRKSTENNKIENKGESKQDIEDGKNIDKNRYNVNGPRRTSSRNRKLKISPDIMDNDSSYKKLESDQQNQDVKRVGKRLPKRPVSVQNQQKTSSEASKDNVRASREKKRAASAGITRQPSEDLVKTSKLAWKAQHQYQHGLDEFFTAGMGGQGSKPAQKTIEPSNTIITSLPKCSFQGAGYWRPDSSLSTADVTYTTVTQFNAEDRNQASSKQQSRSTISYKLSQDKKNYSGSLDRKSATPTQRKPSKNVDRTPPNGRDSRPKSCIEIEGDDFRIYDEDYLKLGKEVTADDEDTLEQLALELESGRNSEVDGPLSRLSMLEDFPDGEYEDQLGIVQDDGLGSGLSTPCEELNIEHEMDEESLKSDFKEEERAQSVMEVNALQ